MMNINTTNILHNNINFIEISGSAYKHAHDRSLHHGTMLINLDLDALDRYLHPSNEKLKVCCFYVFIYLYFLFLNFIIST
jgi:hypothetical protein